MQPRALGFLNTADQDSATNYHRVRAQGCSFGFIIYLTLQSASIGPSKVDSFFLISHILNALALVCTANASDWRVIRG